ncbi:MAG: hypothetical protein ABEK59_06960 [Halobacteria archaeon]
MTSETNQDKDLVEKQERNRRQRLDFVKWWAEYVKTHDDREWGRQVNRLVDEQLKSARRSREELEENHTENEGDGNEETDTGD